MVIFVRTGVIRLNTYSSIRVKCDVIRADGFAQPIFLSPLAKADITKTKRKEAGGDKIIDAVYQLIKNCKLKITVHRAIDGKLRIFHYYLEPGEEYPLIELTLAQFGVIFRGRAKVKTFSQEAKNFVTKEVLQSGKKDKKLFIEKD